MTCENCGIRTSNRLCKQCQLIERYDDTGGHQEATESKQWECVACEHVYESVEFIDCPECGSDRRRAAEVCPA